MTALDVDSPDIGPVLERLRRDDVMGQILERRGRMAELATEAGDVKLDWSDQVARALDHPESLAAVEEMAQSIRSRFEHLIWSGMGGSIQAVHTLKGLGLFDGAGVQVHPLDSTDPASLNRLLREVGNGLEKTLMVGVSMGMTSEEPITHLRWFEALLKRHGIDRPGGHVMVMTLPGSFLDRFAVDAGATRVDIQLDGASHIPGRMSAPSTRVFLLPAALARPGSLREVLRRCDAEAELHSEMVESDPFVRLAAWLSTQIDAGRDMLLLDIPRRWAALAPWVEQVVEESLGKGGRGLLIFHDQDLRLAGAWPDRFSILRIAEGSSARLPDRPLATLNLNDGTDSLSRIATTARFFAGWNLAVAIIGYLQGITFAGQPAVELYKSYARRLRDAPGELPYPAEEVTAAGLAELVRSLEAAGRLGYFDLTVNGAPEGPLWDAACEAGRRFGNEVLRRPVKIRSGPRDYHSTEQSETDGPGDLLSLRILVRDPEPVREGDYSARFLHAQALGTFFAMRDAGRPVLLATVDRDGAADSLKELLDRAATELERVKR